LLDSEQLQKLAQARLQAGIDSRLDRALVERDHLERSLAAMDGRRENCIAAISLRRALAQVWHAPSPKAHSSKTTHSPKKVGP
jgi:outer membrane protein TolC